MLKHPTCWVLVGLLYNLAPSPLVSYPQSKSEANTKSQDIVASILALSSKDRSRARELLDRNDALISRDLWTRLTNEAENAERQGDPERCTFLYELAMQAAAKLKNPDLQAKTAYWLGQAYFAKGDLAAAEKELLESERLCETAGSRPYLIYALGSLGALYIRLADYNRAKDASARCLALSEAESVSRPSSDFGKAIAYGNLGYLASMEGDFVSALRFYQDSLQLYTAMNDLTARYSGAIVDRMVEIGQVHYASGNYGQALGLYTRALDMAKSLNNLARLEWIMNSIGVLYLDQGDYLKASEFFQESLNTATRLGDESEAITVITNIGYTLAWQEQYDLAAVRFEEALRRSEARRATDLIIPALQGLGLVHQKRGQYAEALQCYGRALDLSKELGDKIREFELTWRKADAYYALRDYAQTLEFSNRAVALADGMHYANYSYLALTLRGKLHLARNERLDAEHDFSQAIGKVESIRNKIVGQDQQRASFFERKIEPYHLMVDLFVRDQNLGEALKYAERAKGRTLLDLLEGSRISSTKAMSPIEREKDARLSARITALNNQLYSEYQKTTSDHRKILAIKESLTKARLEYESFSDQLSSSHPELRLARGEQAILPLDEASALVQSQRTAILEFVMEEDRTYLFVIQRPNAGNSQVAAYALEVPSKRLSQLVAQFRERIANRGLGVDKLGSDLYHALLGPARANLEDKDLLILVPDGALWDLPFQALRDSNRYLIEKYAIFYAPSVSVLAEMDKKRKRQGIAVPSAHATLLAF